MYAATAEIVDQRAIQKQSILHSLKVGTVCENFRSSIEIRNVIAETSTGQTVQLGSWFDRPTGLTESDALPEDIDIDTDERC